VFDAYCDALGARVLRWSGSIVALHNTPDARIVEYRCVCGRAGVVAFGASVGARLRSGTCAPSSSGPAESPRQTTRRSPARSPGESPVLTVSLGSNRSTDASASP
jgi:hypothetical protein